ncbi:MAG: hypothetical protein MI974_07315 [Chitinophagales bacterium]|nr:hypothetical protein [Chitinophagales bacterium]
MNKPLTTIFALTLMFISAIASSQTSEIIELDEKNSYQYKNYYEDGSIKSIVGFYTKKPYSSVESFEADLKKYKVKYHGERKKYYQNGQLKESVVYKKGKVTEFMKQYFEDGEEYSVGTEDMPEFQFDLQQQNIWLSQKVQEIENKSNINLQGNGMIVLEISKDGSIKSVKVRTSDETQEKYLMEIGKQIEVKKPAKKDGQNIGTRFAFKVEF